MTPAQAKIATKSRLIRGYVNRRVRQQRLAERLKRADAKIDPLRAKVKEREAKLDPLRERVVRARNDASVQWGKLNAGQQRAARQILEKLGILTTP